MLVRLHRLGDDAIALAQALAVLGITEQRVAAALAGLTMEEAAAAASALARAEILDPHPPAAFVHPLVRDAIYHELPFAERVMRHARAAALLAEHGAPPERSRRICSPRHARAIRGSSTCSRRRPRPLARRAPRTRRCRC